MDQNTPRRKAPPPTPVVRTEQVLESYYGQLIEWGTLLTRGDAGKALDVVHDFWLYLTLTKPDLSGIENLEGYLYTCLRHIYLSGLASSSREALQFVSIAEFDSIGQVLAPNRSGDLLQKQNDLRKVCCYTVWRKASTKSASYFVLHFFHGYQHQEIADLACLPVAAIYRKLGVARAEVRSYLDEPGKLQFTSRDLPPVPSMLWSPLSSLDLFKELRKTIVDARTGDCLPEDELIALYSSDLSRPISCSLLSHIVSCERCLTLVDSYLQRPTLKDREPLDDAGGSSDDSGKGVAGLARASRDKLLRLVQKHRSEILDHRPRMLSIAVDGKILASHKVKAESNTLSARIDRPDQVSFVEVFSELGLRLALLSIASLPPNGPHEQRQRTLLSDDRWLELCLSFDGLGLNSEVTYFDPALTEEVMEDDTSDALVRVLRRTKPGQDSKVLSWPPVFSFLASVRRFLRPVTPSPVFAWSLLIACVFCAAGYLALRVPNTVPTLDAREVLNRSIQVETASLIGQTEHQVLHFEEASEDGSILRQGTIDLWKDGDGKRYMHRLYDTQHRLIAAEWMQRSGEVGQYPDARDAQPSGAKDEFVADNLWKQDVSPAAFDGLGGGNVRIRPTEDGYELTSVGSAASQPRLISATLVLDRHFHAIREVMRMPSGTGVREVRFVQADYECRPASSVPDAIFDPTDQGLRSKNVNPRPIISKGIIGNVQLAELHIAVLYQLNSLNADASEPIEVEKTSDGRIRISGMVADDARKQQILSSLNLLNNHQLLVTRLVSPDDVLRHGVNAPQLSGETIAAYDVYQTKVPADAALRAYFKAHGLSGKEQDAAVLAFSREALGHAQRALQSASALNRLANTFPSEDLRSIGFSSQQQWTEMVAKHSAALEAELRALHEQLSRLTPSSEESPNVSNAGDVIENPAQFAHAANQLLIRTKSLNRSVGSAFASSPSSDATPASIDSLIAATRDAIPLREAVDITRVAVELNASAKTATINRQHSQIDKQSPNKP